MNLFKKKDKKKQKKSSIYSDVIYKYEAKEPWEHTNFMIRFIYKKDSYDLYPDLLNLILTSSGLRAAVAKYKDEEHFILSGSAMNYIDMIKDSDTNNRFVKEVINLLYYLNKDCFQSFLSENIMDESKFIEIPNNQLLNQSEVYTKHNVQLDDIEYIYKKLKGIFNYRQLLNMTYISTEANNGDFETFGLKEYLQYYIDHYDDQYILNKSLTPIIGDLEKYKIYNYQVEQNDTEKYLSVDETIGDVIEEEYIIEEDEEGNLDYNKDNFI